MYHVGAAIAKQLSYAKPGLPNFSLIILNSRAYMCVNM